ncbi:MAG TPA: tetratricopeptide repeat protein [Longimicrobiales bacterium]|nr:tetratricopeptide repeat protein [Longimicrobiales bacterium]
MDPQTQTRIQRGKDAFQRRDYMEALNEFTEVLAEFPRFADLHHLAGLCLAFLGQPEAAIEEFDKALALNGRYVEAHLNRAITLNELGRFDEAREAFEAAQQNELSGEGRFSAAAAHSLALSHAQLGDQYLEAGAVEDAVREHRKAVSLRPGYPDLRNRLAHALLRQGDLDGAEEELDAAVNKDARFVRARATRGLVYFRQGRRDEAVQEWEACRAQDPSDPQVRAYLSMLDEGGEAKPAATHS